MSKVIELPFSIDSSGAVATTEDTAKMWQDRVVSAVMTRFNERIMNPNYGSSAASTTFFNLTEAAGMLQESVGKAFSDHLQPLTLQSVEVYEDVVDEDGILSVSISFSYPKLLSQTSTNLIIKTQYLSRAGEVLLEVGNGR
jgi:phage baseplate assembly protein W